MYEEEGGQQQFPINQYGQERGLLSFQVDNEEIIKTIHRTILELIPEQDNEGNVHWVREKSVTPMMNIRGVNSILSKLRSRMTKVFALSDFDEETIINMTLSMSEEVIDDLRVNSEKYGLRDPTAASAIVSMVVDNYFAVLRKAKNGLYLKFLRTSQIVSEQNVLKESTGGRPPPTAFDEAKKGFFGFMRGSKR